MGESKEFGQSLDNSKAVELTGRIMVVAIIIFFVVVVFVIFLHLYAKWFWWRIDEEEEAATSEPPTNLRRRRRFVFAPGRDPTTVEAVLRRGLEPSVLGSLPAVVYRGEDFADDGLECAVCLSELADGEKARLLPKCGHGFHVDCIDMWFQSHSTCPLCRSSVAPETADDSATAESSAAEAAAELPSFPTNVLFWGDQTQVSSGNACLEESEEGASGNASSSSTSSSNDGALAIDIPIQIPASAASSSSAAAATVGTSGEELKSPVTTRLRSLKRLLSRESRANPNGSNSGSDIEKGNRGLS